MMRALLLLLPLGVLSAGCGSAIPKDVRQQTLPSGEWVSPEAEGATSARERTESVGAIAGQLVDDATGRPVAMGSVSAYQDGELIRGDLSTEDGSFYIRDLPPGTYRVVAVRGGDERVFPDVAVFAGQEAMLAVHFDARRRLDVGSGPATDSDRGALSGMVRDGTKGPGFPGAVVSITSPDLTDALMAMTDENGSFHFPDLPPSTYSVSCYYHLVDKGNVEVRRSDLVIVAGETTRVELEIDLKINR